MSGFALAEGIFLWDRNSRLATSGVLSGLRVSALLGYTWKLLKVAVILTPHPEAWSLVL